MDEDGYLKNIDVWDVRVAEHLAKIEGIEELTGEHWKLITAIRFHYEKYGESPSMQGYTEGSRVYKKGYVQTIPPFRV